MSRRTTHSLAPRPSPLAPCGFTFIEVLFAIIILGIGSIMIAGMLPVAIKQSSDTRNAITGKAACEAGYAYIQAIAASSNTTSLPLSNSTSITLPSSASGLNNSPGRILPLSCDMFSAANVGTAAAPGPFYALQTISGSRVVTSDPRTQWLAFYGRADTGPAKLIVLALHLQNVEQQQSYLKVNDTTPSTALSNGYNEPQLLTAIFKDGGTLDPDTCYFPSSNSAAALDAADTGAFVIVADSPAPSGNTDNDRPYRNNGRVFRLGNRRVDLDATNGGPTYELQPGYDLPPRSLGPDNLPNTPDDVPDASMDSSTTTQVWIVGKGLLNTNVAYGASNPHVGLVQDVGVLTTQVQLPN